jgi:hypothetical protein
MKKRNYLLSLVAPLSMLMVVACSPDQYQQKAEYDDVYFTRNDRKTQPEIVPDVNANPETVQTNTSAQTIPQELQEKYNNVGEEDPVYYFEETGRRVQSANDLNYDDFVFDYNNEYLAYYDLPLDWDTEWSKDSFNDLMWTDPEFRSAWYEQYYNGQGRLMDAYLSKQSNLNNARANFYAGAPTTQQIPSQGNVFNYNMFYGGMMPMHAGFYGSPMWNNGWNRTFNFNVGFGNMNPWFYDPWNNWGPGPGWNVGLSWGTGWNRWNRWNGWNNGWNNPWGPNNVIVVNNSDVINNGRQVTRSGRLPSTSVTSVSRDSRDGAQIRTRSQRMSGNNFTNPNTIVNTRGSRSDISRQTVTRGRSGSSTGGRSGITLDRVRRSGTDQERVNPRSNTTRTGRSRVNTGRQVITGGSNNRIRTSSRAEMTRADVTRASASRSSVGRNAGNLSFNRTSSSNISRSVANRNSSSRSSISRGNSSSRNSFYRGSSSSSSRNAYSRGSSSRSSSGVSRSSSRSTSSSRGSVSSGSSRSSGSSVSSGRSSSGSSSRSSSSGSSRGSSRGSRN